MLNSGVSLTSQFVLGLPVSTTLLKAMLIDAVNVSGHMTLAVDSSDDCHSFLMMLIAYRTTRGMVLPSVDCVPRHHVRGRRLQRRKRRPVVTSQCDLAFSFWLGAIRGVASTHSFIPPTMVW